MRWPLRGASFSSALSANADVNTCGNNILYIICPMASIVVSDDECSHVQGWIQITFTYSNAIPIQVFLARIKLNSVHCRIKFNSVQCGDEYGKFQLN